MNRINELEKEIKKHKALYYSGKPEITDVVYDKLEEELKRISPSNPVLNLVGQEIANTNKVKHEKKMLSLDKTYSQDDLLKWTGKNEVVAIHKIDGVSGSLIYEDGKLVLAKTRGDGQFGENITNKVIWMKNIPSQIDLKDRIEIRGEMYCDERSFFELSEEMIALNLEKPNSQRNIVAGLVGRKENLALNRFINFMSFDVIGPRFKLEVEKYEFLKKYGFSHPEFQIPKSKKEIELILEDTKDFMTNGDYQIDGLVFVYNDIVMQEELGETAHHPKCKLAFKFPGDVKTTTLNSITWQVSRSGILTPVGEVEPVELSGANVSRVTLHNYGVVKQANLKTGDVIEIIRSGEVIPKFLEVKIPSTNVFSVPTICPSCSENIFIEDIRLICRNKKCPAQIKEIILNYIQKIGIEDLSSKRLDEILSKNLISDVADLYDLDISTFLTLDKVKEKLAEKFKVSIDKSKKIDLITFLNALGLSGGAYNKCEKIANAGFNTLSKVLEMTVEQLAAVDGFAQKSANEIVNSIKEKKILIEKLISKGVVVSDIEIMSYAGGPLTGLKICITGALSQKRSEVEDRIKKLGGTCVSSVSKATNILITNEVDSESSKYKKAKELGIKIISEQELFNM